MMNAETRATLRDALAEALQEELGSKYTTFTYVQNLIPRDNDVFMVRLTSECGETRTSTTNHGTCYVQVDADEQRVRTSFGFEDAVSVPLSSGRCMSTLAKAVRRWLGRRWSQHAVAHK